MVADPSSRLKFRLKIFRVVFINGLVLSTAIGLQSCDVLQSLQPGHNQKSDKPSAQSATRPSISSPLPTVLPTVTLNKRAPAGQSLATGAGQTGAIDPVTDLPIPGKGAGTLDPTTDLPIPAQGTNPLDAKGQSSANPATARTNTLPTGKTSATQVPLTKPSPHASATSSLSNLTSPAPEPSTPTKVTPSRNTVKSRSARAKAPDASAMYRVSPSNRLPVLKPSTDGFESGLSATNSSPTSTKSRTSAFDDATGTPSPGTLANQTGSPTTSGNSTSGNNGQPSSTTGYVYDPATAAYKPASSLPVWNPSLNANPTGGKPAASPALP